MSRPFAGPTSAARPTVQRARSTAMARLVVLAEGTRPGARSAASLVAPGLVLLAVGLQVAYPLAGDAGRGELAVLIVAAFAAACLVHAGVSRSARTSLAVFACSAGIGFGAELVGVHTGVPFGDYRYSGVLGARWLGVPLIVALAWTMLAWPSAVVARRLVRGRAARILVGAWALAAADLFLDPQLVALHAWAWSNPAPHLPGIATVPMTNFAGWLLISLVISAALQQVAHDGPDACAVGIYLWLWIAWTVAQVCYLGLPGSAAWGFVAMGVVGLSLVWQIRSARGAPARDSRPVPG